MSTALTTRIAPEKVLRRRGAALQQAAPTTLARIRAEYEAYEEVWFRERVDYLADQGFNLDTL
jgi:hypothetical protein